MKTSRVILILSIILIFSGCGLNMKWGNHFTITVDLRKDIDSLILNICDEKTVFNLPHPDSLNPKIIEFNSNVSTPEKGYPCSMKLEVYSDGKSDVYNTDDFNCNNCDISHYLNLSDSGLVYTVH